MKYKINLELNSAQYQFYNDNTSPLLHLSMGFGGGKTFVLCNKLLNLSKLNLNIHGGLVAPDFQEMKRDVIPEMIDILEKRNIQYKYHGTDHYFEFPWTKGKLFCVSAEKKIRGPNWGYAGINEVTLIPLERYKEVIGRVRVRAAKNPQIASVGTPEGFASEYYDYFIETPPKGLRLIYGSTDDNAHNLNEVYLSNLEDSYDSKMIEAYRRGLWVNMTGNRFYYSYDPFKNDDKEIGPEHFFEYHCSMDFNVDPFCATLWGYDGFCLFGVDQIKLEGDKGFRTENMIEALIKRGYNPQNTVIYPDPAGRARSTNGDPNNVILEKAGFTVRVMPKAPTFRTRQINVNNLLDKRRIRLNPLRCPGIKKDLMGVEQDIITLEKKKDNPGLTHFSDGLDYMCDILFPFTGPPKATRQERLR